MWKKQGDHLEAVAYIQLRTDDGLDEVMVAKNMRSSWPDH